MPNFKKKRDIKRFKKIVILLVVTLLLLTVLLYALLWIPAVQQKIKDIALTEVMKITGSQIDIGSIQLRPFSSVQLTEVFAADRQGDTLLYAHRLTLGLSLSQLLRNRLYIGSIELNQFTVQVKRDSSGAKFNFQFLIDAFASKDTLSVQASNPFVVELGEIRMSEGRVRYDVLAEPRHPVGFDANHLLIHELNMELQLHSLPPEGLSAELKTLSFQEKSGFKLVKLSALVTSDKNKFIVNKLRAQLPNSTLDIPEAWIDFTAENKAAKAHYALTLESSKLIAADLQAFHLPLKKLTKPIAFKVKAAGTLPSIEIKTVQVEYGTDFRLEAEAKLDDYQNWQQSAMRVKIVELCTDAQGIEQFWALGGEQKKTIPALTKADKFRLTADLSGTLSNLNVQVAVVNPAWQMLRAMNSRRVDRKKLRTMAPQLTLQGKVGYANQSGASHFDLKLTTRRFNLRSLISNPELGALSMGLKVKGWTKGQHLQAELTCHIDELAYKNYHYHAIELNGMYRKNSVRLALACKDTNLPLNLNLKVDLHNRKQAVTKLKIQADHLLLSKIGLLPADLNADLYLHLKARLEGTDLELLKASIQVHQLKINSSKGSFQEEAIKIDYLSETSGAKEIELHSNILNTVLKGQFSFGTLASSMQNTLANYFPQLIQVSTGKKNADWFEWTLNVNNTEQLSKSIQLPVCLLMPAKLRIQYGLQEQDLALQANFPRLKVNDLLILNSRLELSTDSLHKSIHGKVISSLVNADETDTLEVNLCADGFMDSIEVALQFNNQSTSTDLRGELKAGVQLRRVEKGTPPSMEVNIRPTSVSINRQVFKIKKSSLEIKENYYRIHDFEIAHSEDEYLRIDGKVSLREEDSLSIRLGRVRLETVMTALQNSSPLKGTIDGQIIVYEALSMPHFTTEKLSIDSIALGKVPVGTLSLKSTWNERLKGLLLDARLQKINGVESTLRGMVFPTKDSLDLKLNGRGIELNWLSSSTQSTLYGLAGQVNMQLAVKGKLSQPQARGILCFDKANIGLRATNTQYKLSDTIHIYPDRIAFQNFSILDERNQAARIEGSFAHKNFSSFESDVRIQMENFLVLNNAQQTDSLYYGTLSIKGYVLISGSQNGLLVKGALANQAKGRIFFKLPQSVNEAQRYNSITYINTGVDVSTLSVETELKKINFPLKIQLTFEVSPDLTLGTVINPTNKDEASISGAGTIDLNYDLLTAQMKLLGTYNVREGRASVTLANITRRTFLVRPGSIVSFKGDPIATTFNIKVEYSLRANLSNLDPNFETFLPSTRTRVNCLLTVKGTAQKIEIVYEIEFPDLDENMKRKTDALLNTEEIKIREIAYLLALGTFSGTSNSSGNLWTSLASASLTSQLNSLLSGVLKENWTIGTELHSDNNNTGVDMDVNISTHLFDQRLTVTSSIGYKSTPNSNNNNVTGDFDAQYKLTKSGNIVLRMYQVANQDYFEQALTTQGVGILYKQQEKKFWNLFRRRKKK